MSLPWPDCHNARDLGGLRLAAGGRIRTGGLIRSDNLDRLTSAGLAAVRSARVSRIIDLRTAGELRRRPSPFAAEPVYLHRPYIDEVADLQRDPVAEATKSATYRGGLGRNRTCIAAAIAAVATAPAGPVVMYCDAGRDRTGILIALLLDSVGAAREEIAADYALTEVRLRDRHDAALAATDPAGRVALRELQSSPPEIILELLAHVDGEYGGTAAYLAAIGVVPAHLAAVRSRLLGEAA